jgi:hypothetical protein
VRDRQVEDQAPAARLIAYVVADFHVSSPLACACRYAVLRADRVSGRAEQLPQHAHHPIMIMRLGSDARVCVMHR